MEVGSPPFVLTAMHQLAELRNPDDNWTGFKDAAERRKRQNRLNVRAHRRRKELQLQGSGTEIAPQPVVQQLEAPTLRPVGNRGLSKEYWDRVDVRQVLLPLPIDQRLLVLVQYNVLRAILTNVRILSVHHLTPLECSNGRGAMPLFPIPATLPASLVPTALQLATPHLPWIDMIPCSTMRDNAIKLEGTFDVDELYSDLIGGLYEGFEGPGIEKNGMLVWSDPWDVQGWELTDGFVRKWGFLVHGCREMIDATNMWRSMRNEEPLIVEGF